MLQLKSTYEPDPAKESVRAATVTDVDVDIDLTDADTLDGVDLDLGDRILVKDQDTSTENGIYVVTDGTPDRARDADQLWKARVGDVVFVQEGDVNGGEGFQVTSVSPGLFARVGATRSVAAHFADAGNSGTAETDLYSDTLAAGMLGAAGDSLEAVYTGTSVASATASRQLRLRLANTPIFDSTPITVNVAVEWEVRATLIRVSSSVIRSSSTLTLTPAGSAAITGVEYVEVSGLSLATASTILKLTGEAAGTGAASDDIVARMARLVWHAAP